MIRKKLYIKEKIESLATMDDERWKLFDWQHIADIGEVLGYLLERIQKLEERSENGIHE